MTKTISTRLKDEEIKRLTEIAEFENIDRSGLVRKFLLNQIKEYNMKEMAEYYRKGVVSLQEAASSAKVSLYEFMDYIRKEKLRPPLQTDKEIADEFTRSKQFFQQ